MAVAPDRGAGPTGPIVLPCVSRVAVLPTVLPRTRWRWQRHGVACQGSGVPGSMGSGDRADATGFALALRDLMAGQGWTIRALARQVPVDAGHLSRILSGQRQAKERLARRCDDLLGTGNLLTSLIVPDAAGSGAGGWLEEDGVGPAAPVAGANGAATARQLAQRLTADTPHPVAVEGLE